MFDFNGTSWSQTAKLTASDGAAVISSATRSACPATGRWSGPTATTTTAADSGSAYVFDFDGTAWTETAKLTASDGAAGDQFGFSVSLSGDRALVGARFDDDNGSDSGSAYVFDFNGTAWSETAKLTASDGAAVMVRRLGQPVRRPGAGRGAARRRQRQQFGLGLCVRFQWHGLERDGQADGQRRRGE